MNYSHVKAKPVVDVATADTLGTIRDLYIDVPRQRVLALQVHLSGLFSGDRVLLWQDVQSLGENAITVSSADVLHEAKDVSDVRESGDSGDILGTKIMSESGSDVGTVSDIEVDPKAGTITSYVLRGNFLESLQHREQLVPASWVKTIGKGLIVVRDQAVSESETRQP